MKKLAFIAFCLISFALQGQDRIELGVQTTRRGVVWYRPGMPTHVPQWRFSRDTNAVMWFDTLTALRYDWDYITDRWRTKGTYKSALPRKSQQLSASAVIDNTTAFWIRDTFNLLHKYDSTAGAWTPIGDFLHMANVPTNIAATDTNGAAIYTRSLWQDTDDNFVRYWDGDSWELIGSSTDTSGYNISLTTSGDTLYLTDGNGTLSVDLDGVGLPPGTNTQTLRHNGTDWVANSTLTNDGTNIGVNAAPSASYKIFVKQAAAQDGISVENSAGTGDVQFYHQTSEGGLRTTIWPLALRSAGILSMYGPGGTTPGHIQIGAQTAVTTATNNAFFLRFNPNYAPTAAGGNLAMLRMVPTINQTGSANGDIYLFDAVPTITNLTGNLHGYRYNPSVGRAIWQPNGSTSVISHHAGKFGFGAGSDAPAQTIHVEGTARITGSDGTATAIVGRDADGDISAVGLGSNLSISGGDLSANDTSGYNLAFAISGDTLRITDADGFLFVDLSAYLDNTDTSGFNTSLYISGDTLYIQDDNSTKAVSLAPYINTDTDNQNLSYAPATGVMSISGGTGDTIPVMLGATAGTDGERGLVGKPSAGDEAKFWRADGTWANPSTGGDNWGTQVVQVTARLSGNGTGGSPLDIAQQGATSGQVLKWNGTTWVPANDTDTDAQTLAIDSTTIATGQSFSLAISNGDTVYFENTDAQQIDTFAYSAGVLSLSVQRDGQPAKTVSIPVADGSETVVTAGTGIGVSGAGTTGSPYVVSNTGDLSAANEGILGVGAGASNTATLISNTTGQTPVTVAGFTGISISETPSANGGTINITNTSPDQVVVIEGGPGILVAESYPNFTITAVDTSFVNEIQAISIDSSVLSYGQRFSFAISGANTLYFEDEDRQTVDTFRVNAGNVELSAQRDGQPVKTIPVTDIAPVQGITAGSGISVSAGPNVTITNNGDLSVTNEIQQIDTFVIVSDVLRASLSLDGVPFKSVDLTQYLDNTDGQNLTYAPATGVMSISGGTGDTIPVMLGATAGTDGERGLVGKPSAGDEAKFWRADGTWANPSTGGDNWGTQVVQVTARLSGNGTGGSPLDIAQQGAASGQVLKWNGTTWVPQDDTDTDLQQVDTFRVNAGNVELSIQRDAQPAKTIPVTSIAPVQAIAAGSGISISGTSTVTVTNNGDLSVTNELQQIDTFTIVSNVLRASLSSDGVPFKSVSLTPYLDNTDEQKADTFAIVSNVLRLSIESDGEPFKSVDLSGYLDNTDDQKADTFALIGNVIRLSLESDGEPFKSVDLSGYLDNTDDQKADTFALIGNVIRLSLESDGEPFKSVDLSGYLDNTDDQKADTFALIGNVIRLSLESDGEPFKSVDLTPILTGGLNGIYGDGTAGTGNDTLPPGGSIVTIPGAWQPLTFRMNVPAASVRTAISVEIDSCSDDKVSKYLVGKSPIDSLEIYNFDCGAVIKETGGIMQIVTDRELYLTADSVSATAPTRTIAPYLLGQDASGFLRKIPGATSGQIMKWNGTNWALAADDTGSGGLTGAENGLNVVANKVRLGGTLLETTTINQATFPMRWYNGKFSHTAYNGSAWTPTQSTGFEGFAGDPTLFAGPVNDGVTEFRVRLEGSARANSLTLGGYTTENQGWWMQSRNHANQAGALPLQLNPIGGPVSVGRSTTLPTARFTVTASGATGSTASGLVALFENISGSGNTKIGFGVGSDNLGAEINFRSADNVLRITNRSAVNGTSRVSIALGAETDDRVSFVRSSASTGVRAGVGVTAPASIHSTIQSAGSLATAFTQTTSSITLSEIHHTVVYTLNSTINVTLPAASTCQGRQYVLHHFGSAGNMALNFPVSSSTGLSFSAVPARNWAWIISDGTNWRGYLVQSL